MDGILQKISAASRFEAPIVTYAALYIAWALFLFTLTGGFDGCYAWLASWSKWDSQWYERIWREGYPSSDPRALVFPPGYSLFIGGLSKLFSLKFGTSALCVNVLAFFAGCVISTELLARTVQSPRTPVFILMLTSPAAYFTFAAYSDSVFFLILWSALFLAIECPRCPWAIITECSLLILAPWIRIIGFVLLSWLMVRRWTAIVIFLSLLGWFYLNILIAGEPLYFIKARKLFLMPDGNFINGFLYSFRGIFSPHLSVLQKNWAAYLQLHVLPVVYLIGLGCSGVWFYRRGQLLMAITIIAVLIMSYNQSFWRSCVRYDLPLFPCLFAMLLAPPVKNAADRHEFKAGVIAGIIGTIQFILQVYFANLFKSGQWAF